jgi:hypothetical protein
VNKEAGAADLAADEVGARVVGPDAEDEEEDPRPLRAERGERRIAREGRSEVAEADDEGELGGIDGAEERADPRPEPLGRLPAENAPTPTSTRASPTRSGPAPESWSGKTASATNDSATAAPSAGSAR